MKKLLVISLIVVGVVAAALGTSAVVNAQSPTQTPINGQGGMGGRGIRGGMVGGEIENEAVHDLMMAAYAEKLNLTVEELNTRTDAGERLSEIALSTGLTFTEFRALKLEVHTAVAAQALADGLITQAEADQMQQFATRQMNGNGMSGSGMRGAARGTGTTCGGTATVTP